MVLKKWLIVIVFYSMINHAVAMDRVEAPMLHIMLQNKDVYGVWSHIVIGGNVDEVLVEEDDESICITPFIWSIMNNQNLPAIKKEELFNLLVQYNVNVDAPKIHVFKNDGVTNKKYQFLLQSKIVLRDVLWVEKLLMAGANPNLFDDFGSSLHIAVATAADKEDSDNTTESFKDAMKILEMVYNASVKFFVGRQEILLNVCIPDEQLTPLHIAVGNGKVMEFLIMRGADTMVKNKEGQTPYEYAKSMDYKHNSLKSLKNKKEGVRNIIVPALMPKANLCTFIYNREIGKRRLTL